MTFGTVTYTLTLFRDPCHEIPPYKALAKEDGNPNAPDKERLAQSGAKEGSRFAVWSIGLTGFGAVLLTNVILRLLGSPDNLFSDFLLVAGVIGALCFLAGGGLGILAAIVDRSQSMRFAGLFTSFLAFVTMGLVLALYFNIIIGDVQ